MMEEVWKPVVGFEDRYQISNLGNLKSNDYLIHYCNGKTELRKGTVRKANISNGYRTFLLVKETGEKRINMKASRMVARAFIPNPENKPCVDHIDTNKLNDSVCNLRWVTHSENNLNPITRERYRKNGTERVFSKTTRYKIGLASKGRKPTQRFYDMMDEKSKEVQMFTKDGELIKTFRNAKFAEKEMGIARTHIYCCCKGTRVSAGGYKWKYKL